MLGLPTGEDLNGVGQLFLLLVYGFILFKAAVLIGDGSEKLLLIYGPGVVGGLVIPVLGAVPDGAIVLVSGLGGDAQSQISIGVGTLAGSTIMLLTIPWALGVFLGARDYDEDEGKAACKSGTKKPKFENGFTLRKTCVTTYDNIPVGAFIMMMTAILYLIINIPAIIYMGKSDEANKEHIPALIGVICCAIAFFGYSYYQIVNSKAQRNQERKVQKAQLEQWKNKVSRKFGKTDKAIKSIFEKFDKDGNGTVDRNELYEGCKAMGLTVDRETLFVIMEQMNTDDDITTLTYDEFKGAIKTWGKLFSGPQGHRRATLEHEQLKQQMLPLNNESESAPLKANVIGPQSTLVEIDRIFVENESDSDEEEEDLELEVSDSQLLKDACILLIVGTILVCIFSDPMVDVIDAFSGTISVPAFYVSFIVTPIASNASEIYSSLIFARKKTTEGISMGFSALYGAACMNNTFVLCIFCVIIYCQDLTWDFIAETIVILITIIIVGIIGSQSTVFVWQAILVLMLFPISLIIVACTQKYLDK